MSKMSKAEAGRLGFIASEARQKEKQAQALAAYEAFPVLCKGCQKALPYKSRMFTYCTRSCAATTIQAPLKRIRPTKQELAQARLAKTVAAVAVGERGHAVTKVHMVANLGNKCMDPECAWDFERYPIDVELDHIDGDSQNNMPSNLRLLCPNCHGLTDTFMAKNRGKSTRAYRRQRYADGKSF